MPKNGEGNRRRKPPWLPSEKEGKQVERMAKEGLPNRVIADILDIDLNTLRKHYGEQLAKGKECTTQEAAVFIARAVKGKVEGLSPKEQLESCKWWAGRMIKHLQDKNKTELTGADGAALVTPVLNVKLRDKPGVASKASASSGDDSK
jgi:hypothetical protein